MTDTKYLGLDVHQSSTVIAVLDSQGCSVMESIIQTKADTIKDFIRGITGWVPECSRNWRTTTMPWSATPHE